MRAVFLRATDKYNVYKLETQYKGYDIVYLKPVCNQNTGCTTVLVTSPDAAMYVLDQFEDPDDFETVLGKLGYECVEPITDDILTGLGYTKTMTTHSKLGLWTFKKDGVREIYFNDNHPNDGYFMTQPELKMLFCADDL